MALTAVPLVSAFSFGGRNGGTCSFVGRSVFAKSGNQHHRVLTMPQHRRAVSTTAPTMLLGNLFGGAFEKQQIPYDTLDHPGPELAAAAQAGIVPVVSPRNPNLHLATFAGGCFWGLELAYQRVPGVEYTAVGYTQGPEQFPTYSQVCSGSTGHTEAVMVYYDPNVCSYEQLLDTFFQRVNPTTVNGQGNDFGTQYRTGAYFHSPEQEAAVQRRVDTTERQKYPGQRIATQVMAAQPFWPAEQYHQQYLAKGGRGGNPQDATKGATDTIRCYG
jgi:peptide-methionine (S)-S-oxide reductase